jgi:hypothetical protein
MDRQVFSELFRVAVLAVAAVVVMFFSFIVGYSLGKIN